MNRFAVSLVAAALFAAVPAAARPGDEPGRLSPAQRAQVKAEVQQKVRTYVTVELSSRLGLDDARALKLAAAVDAHMDRKQAARQALRAEHEKLEDLLGKGADDKALAAQIAVVSQRASAMDLHDELLADCRKFLSVKEQAKLVLAVPDVMRDVGKMARGGKGGGRFRDRD